LLPDSYPITLWLSNAGNDNHSGLPRADIMPNMLRIIYHNPEFLFTVITFSEFVIVWFPLYDMSVRLMAPVEVG
jgi:hypothetical protein